MNLGCLESQRGDASFYHLGGGINNSPSSISQANQIELLCHFSNSKSLVTYYSSNHTLQFFENWKSFIRFAFSPNQFVIPELILHQQLLFLELGLVSGRDSLEPFLPTASTKIHV